MSPSRCAGLGWGVEVQASVRAEACGDAWARPELWLTLPDVSGREGREALAQRRLV